MRETRIKDFVNEISRQVYEAGKDKRLYPDKLTEEESYPLRLIPKKARVGIFALELFCQIQQIIEPAGDGLYDIRFGLIDKDRQPVLSSSSLSCYLNGDGFLPDNSLGSRLGSSAEKGYFLSSIDAWDIALLSLDTANKDTPLLTA